MVQKEIRPGERIGWLNTRSSELTKKDFDLVEKFIRRYRYGNFKGHEWSPDETKLSFLLTLGPLPRLNPELLFRYQSAEDWETFANTASRLKDVPGEEMRRLELITSMARISTDAASKVLDRGELERHRTQVLTALKEENPQALELQTSFEFLVAFDSDRARAVFQNEGVEKSHFSSYASWLRTNSPHQFFTLTASLSKVNPELAIGLLEKQDWGLGIEGLEQFRTIARGKGSVWPMLEQAVAMRTLTPLFQRIFQQEPRSTK